MSDIRVSVQWRNSTVFAGERIECTIIFKNVSQAPSNHLSPSPSSQLLGHTSARERWKETLPLQSKLNDSLISPSSKLGIPQTKLRTHKPAASLSGPSTIKLGSRAATQERLTNGPLSPNRSHRKSISIISLAGDVPKGDGVQHVQGDPPRRPGRGHTRAASLQVLPGVTTNVTSGPLSAPANDRATTMLSPFSKTSTSFAGQGSVSDTERYLITQRSSGAGSVASRHLRKASETLSNFRFPQVPPSIDELSAQGSNIDPNHLSGEVILSLPPSHLGSNNVQVQSNPFTRILYPTSMNGTPRSSGDFYSISNNSTETLASEYVAQDNTHRPSPRAAHSRQTSPLTSIRTNKPPETLMMGYGQITGSYTIDGSLIDQAPFEEVKRKGIIGGQGGGGVVRSDSIRRESGFFGALGWGNIGDSLGGFLGSNELSSIKETKGIEGLKSIPILATPQAILFVNLQLGPGESQTYLYSHPLPKGIPPTHKGRAMRVSYRLTVGTQRAAKAAQQNHICHVDVPFRVLPGVNSRGEVLGYDLMSPYVMLRNDASISTGHKDEQAQARSMAALHGKSDPSMQEFLSYVVNILDKPRQGSSLGLLSPTESSNKSLAAAEEEAGSVKNAIDLAILQSNSITPSKRSPNRFEITKSGRRIAVIVLARPSYRLGETITVAVDFQEAEVSCHSLNATLETSEIVDPAIALRSKGSIHRVTRRVHASQSESTIFATRVVFSPIVPSNATPDFITSGVKLEWRLRFGFVTSQTKDDTAELHDDLDNLLEEVARDGRGSVRAAVRGLPCDTFDVTVPLRIYGAIAGFEDSSKIEQFPI